MDIPTTEPAQIRAGDTTTWKKTVADYPPSAGWTLKYSLRNTAQKIDITAATSGTDYLVTITRNTSKAYVPGRYDWICFVVKGVSPNDEQHTLDQGSVSILPDLSADAVYDARSDARKIYDDLIAAYKTYIASGGTIQSYAIGGRSVTYKDQAKIIEDIKYWERKVRSEEAAEAVANGSANPRRVGTRFNRI